MNSADGHSLGLVEVGHRFVVLDLAIFDDQLELGLVGVDRAAAGHRPLVDLLGVHSRREVFQTRYRPGSFRIGQ